MQKTEQVTDEMRSVIAEFLELRCVWTDPHNDELCKRARDAVRASKQAHTEQNVAPEPCGVSDPTTRDCENMKEVGGGMDGERYRCDVCGKGYFLDYEEMK